MAKIRLVLLFIVISSLILLSHPLEASHEVVKWFRLNIPSQGKAGGWVLASGSDVKHLALAIDGTLYAYVEGLPSTLYKSADGGSSWSPVGGVDDVIVAIATSPADPNVIYYATESSVYKSTDAGSSFFKLGGNPGGAGSDNIEITSIAVAYRDGHHLIAVGTGDLDLSQYGGVYLLDESTPFSDWLDTGVGNYDVYALAFSPDFSSGGKLVAVLTDEVDTWVSFMDSSGWGSTLASAKLNRDNSPISIVVQSHASIAFPEDYDSKANCILFIGIDSGAGGGDVYMVSGVPLPGSSVAIDLNIGSSYGFPNLDITSLAIAGKAASATILAGIASSGEVYRSSDGGSSWMRCQKPPTGESETYVVLAPNFLTTGLAYASTSGLGSAFSYTLDGGSSWNQIALIDTTISNIVDLAFSPDFSQDKTLFMLTHGSEESLWRSRDDGESWERVFSRTLASADSLALVEHSPRQGSEVLFLAGVKGGKAAIWRSLDNGETFAPPQITSDPESGASFPIDILAVADDDTLFIGSFDGSKALLYETTNGGLSYSLLAKAGDEPLKSIALSPRFEEDETIILGNSAGWIYCSRDGGKSFEPLPPDATSPPLVGPVILAFDPHFERSGTIYAASSAPDGGIHRFSLSSSTSWVSIDSSLPPGSMLSGLVLSPRGVLYASNFKADEGMERSLNPTYPLGPTFETVSRGLEEGATLSGLWLAGDRLWSIDSTNIRLLSFIDSLAQAVILTSPPDGSSGMGTVLSEAVSDLSLDWEPLDGATTYQWQLDIDTDFSTIPAGFEGISRASGARLPELMPATTYYWRVRVSEPILSPWSDKWSFTTALPTQTIGLELIHPKASSSGVELRPLFQWSAVAGAEAYELIVATDPAFSHPVILKTGDYALSDTAWRCNVNLDYDTTYYWKVRALGAGTSSAWSASSAFTTTSPPTLESPLSPAPPPPPPPRQPVNFEWLKYLVGSLCLVIVLLVVIILVLILFPRRV